MENRITDWIKRQVKEAGAKGTVIGLSGGVDSALAAALCKKAVGRKRLLALIMPCLSNPQDMKDAQLVAKKLGLNTKTINLSGLYNNFRKILPAANNLAYANLKPRLRMAVLYYFANKLNYLVCGTGNKSELNIGYFTKHGDGATDILPLGCLLKKDVRRLAEKLGVPKQIINKPPSAGLWRGQTDEGEMGISYAELDDILGCLEGNKKQVAPKAKIKKIKEMIRRSEHKRQGPRICHISRDNR
ncbi:MAG: NAD+ synthase [Candidatus Omnitrophota bacterium]